MKYVDLKPGEVGTYNCALHGGQDEGRPASLGVDGDFCYGLPLLMTICKDCCFKLAYKLMAVGSEL